MDSVNIEDYARTFDASIDDVADDVTSLLEDKITFELEEIEDAENLPFRELLEKIVEVIESFKKEHKKLEIVTQSVVENWPSIIIKDFVSILKEKDLFYEYTLSNLKLKEANKKVKKKNYELTNEDINDMTKKFTMKTIHLAIAEYLNDRIIKTNEKIDNYYRLIKNDLRNISEIENLIRQFPIDSKKIEKLIENTYLGTSLKDLILVKANEYIAEKNTAYELKIAKERIVKAKKEELESLHKIDEDDLAETTLKSKMFSINNYDYIEPLIDKYSDLFPTILMSFNIEELLQPDELKEVLEFNFIDIDDEVFSHAFMTLLYQIDKLDNESRINILVQSLTLLCLKYELYNKVINTHEEIRKVFTIPTLTAEEVEILSNIKTQLFNIYKEKNYDNVNTLLDQIHLTLYNIKNTNKPVEKDKIEIKAFTLFDYHKENGEMIPYVTSDLDANNSKNFIDESLNKESKLNNSYIDFNELIDDILIYGELRTSLESHDKLKKLVRPVFFSGGAHKNITSKMSNASGIYRIRPRTTSNLRFFEEKIVFQPDSEKFKQIEKLLESKLPNIIIDNTQPFVIHINYLDAIKQKDLDSYNIAQKRQNNSELRNVLKTDNVSFTEEELAILSDAIDLTLSTFKELPKINDNFEFNTINHLSGQDHKHN